MQPATERHALQVARLLAVAALVVAVAVLAGHAFAVPLLVRFHANWPAMSVLTACSVAALAIGAIGATQGHEQIATGAVATALLPVAVALFGLVVHGTDIASPWAAGHLLGTAPDAAGRVSDGTALTLLLLAIGLATRRRALISDASTGLALLISATALLGFLYDARNVSAPGLLPTTALPAAIASMALALALLLVEPRRGWSKTVLASGLGGRVTRRQLGLLMLPVVVGWALHFQPVSLGAALVFLVILTVAPMALLVMRDGRAQVALDKERDRHAEAQATLERGLELRLAAQAEQLERQGVERSRVEEAMYRTQRVEAIGQLSGGIAHDFNNLLTAIGGNLELLLRKLPEGEAPRRHAVVASAAVAKGARLASQMLAFSRSQRLMIRPTEVTPALKRAREVIGTALGPSIELLIEYSRDAAWAKTDPDQLELAIFNLAVNARDALPNGGQVRIESSVRRARIGAAAERDYVSIRVIDDGVGMTREVLAKAIEPFFTTRGPGRGSGLGLAQVDGFARQCEGDLLIDSAPGAGTTIEILLPSTAAPDDAVERGRMALRPVHGADPRTRLLVVDDDDSVRGVLVELLGDAGYDVSEAADGLSALASLERIDPQVAVIDFMMPGMNGAEVARLAQARLPRLPIVFVSGYHDTMALDGIAGAVVLRKPFGDAQLQSAVATALESRVA